MSWDSSEYASWDATEKNSSSHGRFKRKNSGRPQHRAPRPSYEEFDENEFVDPNAERNEEEIFADVSKTGIDFSKYDQLDIQCQPEFNAPHTFDEFNLPKNIMDNVKKCGYTVPTPIQRYTIPLGVDFDIMATSQTGSGKTAAFVIPVLKRVLSAPFVDRKVYPCTPKALIIAPTRELALQINEVCRRLSFNTSTRTVVCYGGSPINFQLRQLYTGADIIIGTPGRLLDLLGATGRPRLFGKDGKEVSDREEGVPAMSLVNCSTVVLDEADRLLDMGFEKDIRKILDDRITHVPTDRRTLMFSATFPNEIQNLARDMLRNDMYRIEVGRVGGVAGSVKQIIIREDDRNNKITEAINIIRRRLETPLTEEECCVTSTSIHSLSTHNAKQIAMNCDPEKLKYVPRILVFANRKGDADNFASILSQENISAVSMHGDKPQSVRETSIVKFKLGIIPVLIATDVAQRGLDIPSVSMVLNLDFPNSMDSYTHRVGRTARAGRKGEAVTFISYRDLKHVKELIKTLEDAGSEVPRWLTEMGMRRSRPRNSDYDNYKQRRSDFRGKRRNDYSPPNRGSSLGGW